jgi:hypothetical protein
MCMTCQQQGCGCRQQCPELRMGRLWQLQRNRFLLWTYWHCTVARFLRRWLRRQSTYGRRGGDLWGSTMVDLLHQWAPLEAVTKFGATTATVLLPWVLSVKGARVLVGSERGGRKVVRTHEIVGTLWLWQHNNVWFVDAVLFCKKI